jgi:hypothetical protein
MRGTAFLENERSVRRPPFCKHPDALLRTTANANFEYQVSPIHIVGEQAAMSGKYSVRKKVVSDSTKEWMACMVS